VYLCDVEDAIGGWIGSARVVAHDQSMRQLLAQLGSQPSIHAVVVHTRGRPLRSPRIEMTDEIRRRPHNADVGREVGRIRPRTSIKPTVTRTAAADERGYLVQLLELSTLGVTVPAVHVNVAELGYGIDRVLGTSFLLDFNIEIRPAERRILVEKIAP
jgi:hypothetical protein